MIYGYVRVSTKKQHLDRQIINITAAYPDAVIVCDKFTGTTIERPNWTKLTSKLQKGDTVVFDSVSRMSRNAAEGAAAYRDLYTAGVDLVFLKEPSINTATYKEAIQTAIPLTGTDVDLILHGVNAYLLKLAERQIELAFDQAEKEAADTRQRIKEGLAASGAVKRMAAKKTGMKYNVKKSAEAKAIIRKHSRTFGGALNDTEVIKLAGLARGTYYKYKNEIAEEMVRE